MTILGADPAEHLAQTGSRGSTSLLPAKVHVVRTGAVGPAPGSPEWEIQGWDDHRASCARTRSGGPWVLNVVAAAGLTGHGGGHFPVTRKWRWALDQRRVDAVVANGAESESLSAKDALLMRLRPHLVLDGLLLTAETLGARRAVVWVHAADRTTAEVMQAAVVERRWLSVTDIDVVCAPSAFLSGESSAVKRALSGGPAIPSFEGFGRDQRDGTAVTVVHNVETLARIATAVTESETDTPRERSALGSRLVTILTPTERCVVEVPRGMAVAEAVRQATGRQPPPTAGVLLGGFGGHWARWADVARRTVDTADLPRDGWSLGPGVIAPLWEPACGLAETAAIADYLASESAGQCGPCLFGLPALAKTLRLLRDGKLWRDGTRRLLRDVRAVDGRGACHHPDGAARLASSMLEAFDGDVDAHAAGHPCQDSGRTTLPVPAART